MSPKLRRHILLKISPCLPAGRLAPLCQRGEFLPFGREESKDLILSVHTINLKIAPLMFRQPRKVAQE